MNTGTRRMVDSEKKEKKVWARPVLTRLDVKETAAKPGGACTDSYGPPMVCGHHS